MFRRISARRTIMVEFAGCRRRNRANGAVQFRLVGRDLVRKHGSNPLPGGNVTSGFLLTPDVRPFEIRCGSPAADFFFVSNHVLQICYSSSRKVNLSFGRISAHRVVVVFCRSIVKCHEPGMTENPNHLQNEHETRVSSGRKPVSRCLPYPLLLFKDSWESRLAFAIPAESGLWNLTTPRRPFASDHSL
jgi:hypothetical protein